MTATTVPYELLDSSLPVEDKWPWVLARVSRVANHRSQDIADTVQ